MNDLACQDNAPDRFVFVWLVTKNVATEECVILLCKQRVYFSNTLSVGVDS